MLHPPTYQPAIPYRKQKSDHRARIGAHVSARLARQPGVRRLARWAAEVFVLPDFLDIDTCQWLMERIARDCEPSKVLGSDEYTAIRTSQSCNFDPWAPEIQALDQKVADLLGLDVNWGETIQGQVYDVGQEFRNHPDFFDVSQPTWEALEQRGGQRTWTAMVYLNQPEAGGATRFPHLGFEVKPSTGLLLAWNNMARDGSPNPWTFHAGSPVEAGVKYIFTKWFRESAWR